MRLCGQSGKRIATLDEYLSKYNTDSKKVFDKKYKLENKPSKQMIEEILREADKSEISFIE